MKAKVKILFIGLSLFMTVFSAIKLMADETELKGALVKENGELVFKCPHERQNYSCSCGCGNVE